MGDMVFVYGNIDIVLHPNNRPVFVTIGMGDIEKYVFSVANRVLITQVGDGPESPEDPWPPTAFDTATPVRRFVGGMDTMIKSIQWPKGDAALAASKAFDTAWSEHMTTVNGLTYNLQRNQHESVS
jgi:hypothetical protein